MEKIITFLEAYFIYIWLVLMITTVSIFFIKGRKALKEFGDIDYSKARFYEKFASGYTVQSKWWKRGRASKSLHVLITDTELILKSSLFGAGIAKRHDMLHRIPLENILSTEERSVFLQTELRVKCQTTNGETKEIVLISKSRAHIKELLDEAIQKNKGFK